MCLLYSEEKDSFGQISERVTTQAIALMGLVIRYGVRNTWTQQEISGRNTTVEDDKVRSWR
jgi:hypothetical protein